MRCLLLLIAPALFAQPPHRPLVGGIRWDAWHGSRGTPGRAVEASLGPANWHYRLPFFARVISDSEVSIDGASQQVIDKEIAYARQAGLDYWAFVAYDPADPMSLGLTHFLASEHKRGMRFCLITEHGRWGTKDNYRDRIERFAALMAEKSYLKLQNGRPLLYLGFIKDDGIRERWGTIEQFRKAVDDLRKIAKHRGLGDPYIVIMDFNPERADRLRREVGADAISSYAAQGNEVAAPYSRLAAYAERFWDRCAGTGSEVVPIVMSGWDRRPRVERPVPWETWQKPGQGIEKFYETATPDELASHLLHALDWIKLHPKAAPANVALIYAWNENDEGGWLVPTLSEGTARLDAIRSVLRGYH